MKNKEINGQELFETNNLTRRDALKLAGAVASLGAGLGVILDATDAQAGAFGQLQLKFYRLPEKGDESNAELIATLQPTPEEEKRIAEVRQGQLQWKFYMVQSKIVDGRVIDNPKNTLLVKQIVPLDPVQLQGKF